MGRFLLAIVLLIAAVAALGYYLDWFTVSTGSSDDKPNVTITVNKDKIQKDTERVEKKARDLGNEVKEKAR